MLSVALLCVLCGSALLGPVWTFRSGPVRTSRSDDGNFMDDKWERWDRFRDEPGTWMPSKPKDKGLDPCRKVKCGPHKVCVAEDYKTTVCISQRKVSFKDPGLLKSPGSKCVPCPVVHPHPVCGSDGHSYPTKCKLEYQACITGKTITVKCQGMCPCTETRVCSESDLKAAVGRLREWFRVLHENGSHRRTKLQKPDKSKFNFGASPICKDPLGWMFSRLDTNSDLQLNQSEMRSLDYSEPCATAFFRSCDASRDSYISSAEWCTCFQRHTDSPCKVELSNINKKQAGKKLSGQYLPACDDDGYYRTHQCHGGSGQCWCVDRYGNEASGSRTPGPADCGVVLESSGGGDAGSGDFLPLSSDEEKDAFSRIGAGGSATEKVGMDGGDDGGDDDDEDDEDEEEDGVDGEYLS